MSAEQIVEKGVKLFAKIETGLADAAEALVKLHELYGDAYANGILSGTEAMEGRARILQTIGTIGMAQAETMSEHVFAAEKAKEGSVDIDTPYAPLPPRLAKSGGR